MLKVGAKVKIRDDLKVLIDIEDIIRYVGMEAIITDRFSHRKVCLYKIDLDDGMWLWDIGMFEPEEIINKEDFEEFMRS